MVDIDLSKFNALKKSATQSYNQQKVIIKKVLAGNAVNCTDCQNLLALAVDSKKGTSKISCKKGCTDIALDIDF